MSTKIVIVGAGVSGLTTASLLSKDPRYAVTVVAKHMPGDYDIEYASPWAGANYTPFGARDDAPGRWERSTWPVLQRIAQDHPEAGLHFLGGNIHHGLRTGTDICPDNIICTESTKATADLWYEEFMPNFEHLPREHLPPGVESAHKFTSVCINTAIYLPWLVGQCAKKGVVFKRGVFTHIEDAVHAHASGSKADVVVNCTGLSSKVLGGVMDDRLYPARGQTVLVRNDPGPMIAAAKTSDGEDEMTYIMTRAAGGGTVLGGSYQKNNWDALPDPHLAHRIMQRAIRLNPHLVGEGRGVEGLDIIGHRVGLRPVREGGPRVERDEVNGIAVVHNYGHGGSSWGIHRVPEIWGDDAEEFRPERWLNPDTHRDLSMVVFIQSRRDTDDLSKNGSILPSGADPAFVWVKLAGDVQGASGTKCKGIS
ncbi:hypothetical protein N7492_004099 [Penicillium capsulatum]|uniref:FAD dependent oxidoreductase domain-containing protein n=1 Tax=Penicillium capsulatum TaxID=69766 RepID=A0A9W9IN43_9EURO|nr:hypothetical protein N7492_004099 [Penicillium capsulatum]KAJ6121328.1 hypothetical protein N7512_003793 [Penicillium capsulatum]